MYTQLSYAGFFRRLAAFAVDSILGVVLFFLLIPALRHITFNSYDRNQSAFNGIFWIILILAVLYGAILEASKLQGTLGKLILGIKVTKTDGSRLSFINALGRSVIKLGSVLFLGIGCLIAAFTEKHQALHDFPANSIVVLKKAGNSMTGGAVSRSAAQPWLETQARQLNTYDEQPRSAYGGAEAVKLWDVGQTVIVNISEEELPKVTAQFHNILASLLAAAGLTMDNRYSVNQIYIAGHFVSIDGGKRALRYFTNGLAGRAGVEAEGEVIVNNVRVAYLHAKKNTGLAFQVFGGDNLKMLIISADACAKQIAEQAIGALASLRRVNPA